MASSLIQIYLGLPLGERDAALASLIRTVGKDRHSLQLVQKTISDTCDPLNRLPIELVINIFDCLHPFDVWSLRRTCQRWNARLSSTQLIRNALNRFATQHPADTALVTNTRPDADPSLTLELRHTLALRLARPFTYISLPATFDLSTSQELTRRGNPLFQLKGKHIAYVQADNHSVVVHDLVSGHMATVCGQAREAAMNIALSTDIVAFVAFTGILYVASLLDLTASPSRVRLPSACATTMAAEGGTVACHLGSSVLIYRVASRESSLFSLKSAQTIWEQTCSRTVQHVCAMSVNEDTETVDIAATVSFNRFYSVREAQTDLRVVISRFSFAGEYITQVIWEQQVPALRAETISLGQFQPTGDRGIYSMELSYRYHHASPVIYHAIAGTPPDNRLLTVACLTLFYDEVHMSLEAADLKMASATLPSWDYSRPLRWKDRLYRADPHTGPMAAFSAGPGSRTLDAARCDEGLHTLEQLNEQFTNTLDLDDEGRLKTPLSVDSRLSPRGDQKRPTVVVDPCHDLLAMNDSFIVTRCSDSIEVACLDERIDLHGAESTKLWEPEACYSKVFALDYGLPYILPSSA